MAEDDIYKNERAYERFKANLSKLTIPPEKDTNRLRKYYCKNPENMKYYKKLFSVMEARDLSYIRRQRLCSFFLVVLHHTSKELSLLEREDVNEIVAMMHKVYKTAGTKSDFIKYFKYVWKIILPEKDERGRYDETIVPYVVRHLSARVDKSKERVKDDKFDFNEYQKYLNYFSDEPQMQFYLSLSVEGIARPQEMLWRKIKDIQLFDNYAIITISDHGKEGVGIVQCIDSYPFLIKLLESHPYKTEPEAYIFLNSLKKQLKPSVINQKLKKASRDLNINKRVTCYSLKRNGVTFRRLKGESDMEIQHAARWTSTKQLKIYDKSTPDEALRLQLMKRGLIKAGQAGFGEALPSSKKCHICQVSNPFNSMFCSNCKRPLDRDELAKKEEVGNCRPETLAIQNFLEKPEIREMLEAHLSSKLG